MSLGTARTVVISALIVSLGMLPAASAGQPPLCDEAPDASDAHLTGSYYLVTGVTVEGGPTDGSTSVDASATGLWEDTNRLDGIQTERGTCRDGNGRQLAYDADTQVGTETVNDGYEDLNDDVNDAYDDTIETVNETWAALEDLINSLF